MIMPYMLRRGVIPKVGAEVKPLIGSGKISRRIYFRVFRKRTKKINYDRRQKSKQQLRKDKLETSFPSRKVEIAFQHWTKLGPPFPKHKLDSRTGTSSINALTKVIKKHGLDEVLDAMDLAHEAFISRWFIYRFHSKMKISLVDFIKYRQKAINNLSKKFRNSGVDSWFKEFLKGSDYIEATYSATSKDNNPDITAKIADLWRSNKQTDRLTTREDNNCIACAARLVLFAEANNFEIRDVISIVDKILSNFWGDTKELKHSGYLVTDIFWHETVPDAYIKFGIVERRRQIEIV
jgi:hypothetical protein